MRTLVRNLALFGPTFALFILLGMTRRGDAYPADVFVAGSPAKGPAVHKSTEVSSEAYSVSTSTGAAQYTFPIPVPPGRASMAPQLALQYSSQNPVRGEIAAGWTLPIPAIEVDTSQGVLGGKHYRSTLAGGQRLVRVFEPATPLGETYRAESDPDFVRYERVSGVYWRVLHLNGNEFRFGELPVAREIGPNGAEGRLMLSRVKDPFGNEIEYEWEKVFGDAANGQARDVPIDLSLQSIEYGANTPAGLSAHARIRFVYTTYSPCPGSNIPKGAAFSYRNGVRTYKGAQALQSIHVESRESPTGDFVTRHRIDLTYDAAALSCDQPRGPLRLLTTISQTAWDAEGVATTIPPITFGYGTPGRILQPSTDRLPAVLDPPPALPNLGWGYRHLDPREGGGSPTIQTMLADVDGDSFTDILEGMDDESSCQVKVSFNDHGSFGAPVTAQWPQRPWQGDDATPNRRPAAVRDEACNLSYQFDSRETPVDIERCGSISGNYNYFRLVDLDGDAVPELVSGLQYKRGSYHPLNDAAIYPTPPAECPDEEPPCVDSQGFPVVCSSTQWTFDTSFADDDPPQPGDGCPEGECQSPTCDPDTGRHCSCGQCIGLPSYGLVAEVFQRADVSSDGTYDWPGEAFSPGTVGAEDNSGVLNGNRSECAFRSERRCDRYVWRVRKFNRTSRTWVLPDTMPATLSAPIPLESERGVGGVGEGGSISRFHALIDIDGDRCVDAVYLRPRHLDSQWSGDLQILRGDCHGNFEGDPASPEGGPYIWPMPDAANSIGESFAKSDPIPPEDEVRRITTELGNLADMNGDGLVDLVRGDSLLYPVPTVHFNMGWGFEEFPTQLSSSPGVTTLHRDETRVLSKDDMTNQVLEGWSISTLRQHDFDSDGLADLIELPLVSNSDDDPWNDVDRTVCVHVNVGDRLIPTTPTAETNAWWPGLARITRSGGLSQARWRVETDVRDFNGDGLPDHFGSLSDARIHRDARDVSGQGMRMLRTIDNGRGARIEFEYRSSADPQTISVIPNNNSRLPDPIWVVRRLTVHPGKTAAGADAPPAVTEYTYIQPIYNQDRHGQFGFRGFIHVRSIGPSNATGKLQKIHRRFEYNLDYSGRLADVLVFDEADHLLSIESSTWKRATLFDAKVEAFFDTDTRSYVCDSQSWAAPNQENDCRARGALARTTRKVVPVDAGTLSYSGIAFTDLPAAGNIQPPAPDTFPILYVVRGERLTADNGQTTRTGDRGVVLGQSILYSTFRYERLETDARRVQANSVVWSNFSLVGRNQTIYDSGGLGLPIESRVWHDSTTYASTTRTFDASTGNVVSVIDPNGLQTDLVYDPRKLYVTEKRPVLPSVDLASKYTYDFHTGLLKRAEAPVQPGRGAPTVVTEYDGAGRPVRISRSVDTTQTSSDIIESTRFSYVDDVIPNRVVSEERIDLDAASPWLVTTTETDGLGRALTRTVQSPEGDVRTTYVYDVPGNLVSLSLPSPTGTGVSTFAYEHDALGRVTRSQQPGTSGEWHFVYDGARTTRRQQVTDGSAPLDSVLETDGFGRLIKVSETRDGQPAAVWTYAYDANDNLSAITDADNIQTTLLHDFDGHRTDVTRAGRSWNFDYDAGGKLIAETTPGGPPASFLYTSTWTYDALGRVKSHHTAPRALGPDALARYFPRDTEGLMTTYEYDDGSRLGVGRLTHVELPFGAIDNYYTIDGLLKREDRSFAISPFGTSLSDSRSMNIVYNVAGQPTRVKHADSAASPTIIDTTYDARALPRLLKHAAGSPSTLLAQVDRNLAGVPTVRFSGFAQGQTWSYDPLGRVVAHRVRACLGQGPVTPATSRTCASTTGTIQGGESIAYDDAGNVESLEDGLRGTQFAFSYDRQHQLESAATILSPVGSVEYSAELTYSPAGRVFSANIQSSNTGADVWPRNVTYDYVGTGETADPAAVRRLVHGTQVVAAFDYDASGNLARRTATLPTANETHDFVYDGDDNLREAVLNGRSEVYYYDHTGARMLAYVSGGPGVAPRLRQWFGATEIEYVANVSPGTVARTQVFASLGAMPVARIERIGTSTTIDQLYSGVLGSLLVVLATSNGMARAQYGYGPFGEELYAQGPAAADFHRRFNGEEHDEFTSLSYYGARYYDRLSLSWTQFDPLYRLAPDLAWDEPRRASHYTFSLNNPLRYIDPDGRDPGRQAPSNDDPNYRNLGPVKDSEISPGGCEGAKPPAGMHCAGTTQWVDGQMYYVWESDGVTKKKGRPDGYEDGRPDGTNKVGLIEPASWSLELVPNIAVDIETKKAIDGAIIVGSVIGAGVGAVTVAAKELAAGAKSAVKEGLRGARVSGDALKAARKEFEKVKPGFWKDQATTNPGAWSAKDLDRMKRGRPPIGADGHPMELHHRVPLAQGGTNQFDNMVPMTQTQHRLGPNYKKNHPGLP
jgi:RHS repeat-associated protein